MDALIAGGHCRLHSRELILWMDVGHVTPTSETDLSVGVWLEWMEWCMELLLSVCLCLLITFGDVYIERAQ